MSVFFFSLKLKLYYFHPTHRHTFFFVLKQQNKNYPGVSLEFLNGLNGLSIYQGSKLI